MYGSLADLNKFISNFDLYLDRDEISVIVKVLLSASYRGCTDYEKKVYNEFLQIFSQVLTSYDSYIK